jgi:4-amino-4-deoxy-L-arabinose transferase-like glycosyltransferase
MKLGESNHLPPSGSAENKEPEDQDHVQKDESHFGPIHVHITADLPEGTCLKVTLEAVRSTQKGSIKERKTITFGSQDEATSSGVLFNALRHSTINEHIQKLRTKILQATEKTKESLRISLVSAPQIIEIKRLRILLAGIIIILLSQLLILKTDPVFELSDFSIELNQLFHIDVPNLTDTLLSICGFFLGSILVLTSIKVPGIAIFRVSNYLSNQGHLRSKYRSFTIFIIISMAAFGFLIWQLATREYRPYQFPIWILSIVSGTYAAFAIDRIRQVKINPQIKQIDYFAIGGLLFIGLLVGTYTLQQFPNTLMGDEGSFWDTAYAIAENEYNPFFFKFGVYFYPVASSIYQGWFLKIFGLSLWSWRFSSVFVAVLAVIPTYLLARELYNRRIAFFSGTIMVLTPYFIAFERLGYNNSQAILPTVLTIYLFYVGLKRNSFSYLYLGGMVSGFGFYTYPAGRLGFLTGILFLVLLIIPQVTKHIRLNRIKQSFSSIFKNNHLKSILILTIFFIQGWLLTAGPHITYGYTESPIALKKKTAESLFINVFYGTALFGEEDLFRDHPAIEIGDEVLFYRSDLTARLLVRGIIRTFLVFHHDELVHEHFISGPLAGPYASIFLLLGLIIIIKGVRQSNNRLIAIWFFMGILFLSILNTFPPRHQHMVSIIPSMAILTSLGIVAAAKAITSFIRRNQILYRSILAAICVSMLAVTNVNNYFVSVSERYVPNFENNLNFIALEFDEPIEMVLIYNDPEKEDFIPWVIGKLPTNVNYQTLALNEIKNFKISESENYLFFYEGDNQFPVFSELESVLGEQVFPTNLYNKEGNIIGVSYTNNNTSNLPTRLHYDAQNFVSTFTTFTFIVLYFYSALIFVSLKGQTDANERL